MGKALLAALVILIIGVVASAHSFQRDSVVNGQRVPCINVVRDGARPGVTYQLSVPNVIIGAVWSETLVVPVAIMATDFFCPVPTPATGGKDHE